MGEVELGDVVAAAVRAERSRRRWTQDELAERLGWSRQVVTAVEAGRRPLLVSELPAICKAFGLPLSRFLQDADPGELTAMGLTAG
ncbi:MAG TPA: helix-turn-helix transcriptional regulator [Kineosporiaceae bacterium]|nr:helix-turn-helix transcriptional regulator [Kineosporiaceae bacterium]